MSRLERQDQRLLTTSFVASLLTSLLLTASAGMAQMIAYRGATLFDGHGGEPVADSLILVEGTTIVAVGSTIEVDGTLAARRPGRSVAVPPDATVVDLTGRFVMPGLVDTHVHFMESGRLQDLRYYGMEIEGLEISKEDEERWFRERLPRTLAGTLCAGVTTTVSLGGPKSLEYGARQLSLELDAAPRVIVAGGPLAEGDPEALFPDFGGEMCTFQASTPQEAREQVRAFKADGADLVKLGYLGAGLGAPTGPSIEDYAPVLRAAVDESRRQGLRTVTHLMAAVHFETFLAEGITTDGFAHIPFDRRLDPASDGDLIGAIRDSGIPVTGTITVFQPMVEVFDGVRELLPIEERCGDPEIIETWSVSAESLPGVAKMMAAALRVQQGNLAHNAKVLHEAGIEMAVGSDAAHVGQLHGPAMHYELIALQEAGIPASDLIVAATRGGARVLGRDDLGTLEAGRSADFLVLEENPAEDIRHAQTIVGVASQGRYFSKRELDPAG